MNARSLCVLLALSPAAAGSPADAIRIAHADAKALPAETAYWTRYWDLTHRNDEGRKLYAEALTLQINCLSREALLTRPRFLAGGAVLSIDLRDYRIDRGTYGQLNGLDGREPYFHVVFEVEEADQYGKKSKRKTSAPYPGQNLPDYQAATPWLPAKEYKELQDMTQSGVPVLRGDWFFAQTCISADRGDFKQGKGTSYYNFLGLRNRNDYFKLIGFDEAKALELQKQMAEVVARGRSGVAQNARFVLWFRTFTGSAWATYDFFETNRDKKNPARILDPNDKNLDHDAEEWFGTLPNGLWAVLACDARGNLQTYAPAEIGADETAPGRDKRIHTSLSCFSCHSDGGLKDVSGYVRDTFTVDERNRGQVIRSPSKDQALLFRRLYGRDLAGQIQDDRNQYAKALAELGLDAKKTAQTYRAAYDVYWTRSVTADDAAAEMGVSRERFDAALAAYRKANAVYDPTIAPLVSGKPVQRDVFEELVPTLYTVLQQGGGQ